MTINSLAVIVYVKSHPAPDIDEGFDLTRLFDSKLLSNPIQKEKPTTDKMFIRLKLPSLKKSVKNLEKSNST